MHDDPDRITIRRSRSTTVEAFYYATALSGPVRHYGGVLEQPGWVLSDGESLLWDLALWLNGDEDRPRADDWRWQHLDAEQMAIVKPFLRAAGRAA